MEERKRPASHDDGESAPPLKRQATSKDAAEKSGRKRDDAELPGGADIELFKKEAILRRMHEYKRASVTLENQLADAVKAQSTRDDYIRQTDVFAENMVERWRQKRLHTVSYEPYKPVPAELLSGNDFEAFVKYMDDRTAMLLARLDEIFDTEPGEEMTKAELEQHLARCKELEKTAFTDLEKARQERDQLINRLETATQRYMLAERRLDRAKCSTVQKMEQQAIASSRPDMSNAGDGKTKSEQTNGVAVDSDALHRSEDARARVEASAAKQKEQLTEAVTENEKLRSQLTLLTSKHSTLTDDDFAATDLFKHLRTQHDEVIRRVNDLEATNIELRKEAERLQAERTAYRSQVDLEQQNALNERDTQLVKVEADIARIRSARDELYHKVQTYESNEEQERVSIEQLRKFVDAKDDRILALETQIERLSTDSPLNSASIEGLSEEELRKKYSSMEQQYEMMNQELQGFGQAYKKLQSSIITKIANQTELEERVKRAVADKNKSDQKYFAVMKAKDTLGAELRALRAQSSKSSDLISGLREAEQKSGALVQALESQLAKSNEVVEQLTKQSSKAQSESAAQGSTVNDFKSQVEELKKQLEGKDSSMAEMRAAKRKADVEAEELKASVKELDKRLDSSKNNKASSVDSDTVEMYRTLAMCTVCRKNFKDTAIKTCGHTMCHECVEERITSRSRKCPHCTRPFGRDDYMRITMN